MRVGRSVAATHQLSVFIGQRMQFTGWNNANNMSNATYRLHSLLFILYTVVQGLAQLYLKGRENLQQLEFGFYTHPYWEVQPSLLH